MTPASRQRRREKRARALVEYMAAIASLRTAGKSCANCSSFKRAPTGMKGRICDLKSDSEGYVIVQPDYVCPDHTLQRSGDQQR